MRSERVRVLSMPTKNRGMGFHQVNIAYYSQARRGIQGEVSIEPIDWRICAPQYNMDNESNNEILHL